MIRCLIDTGADTSVLLLQSLKQETLINKNNSIELTGLANNPTNLKTIGSCIATLIINGIEIQHEFQILDKTSINLSHDAILGSDFLKKCNIQYTIYNYTIPKFYYY